MPSPHEPTPSAPRRRRVRRERSRRRYGERSREQLADAFGFVLRNPIITLAILTVLGLLGYYHFPFAVFVVPVILGTFLPLRASRRDVLRGALTGLLVCGGPILLTAYANLDRLPAAASSHAGLAMARYVALPAVLQVLSAALVGALAVVAWHSLRRLDRRGGPGLRWCFATACTAIVVGDWVGALSGRWWQMPGLLGLAFMTFQPRSFSLLPELAGTLDYVLRVAIGLPLGILLGSAFRWFASGLAAESEQRPDEAAEAETAPKTVALAHSPTGGTEVHIPSAAPEPVPIEAPPGSPVEFGEHELLAEIGRGGMGRVYKARQKNLDRVVALKTILTGPRASPQAVQRFRSEAEAAARLEHPGIVPVYGFGEHDGQHFFTMAFIEGQSLAARLAGGPIDGPQAALLVQQAAEATAFAHDHGVVHRDLKPGNILLDRDGTVRVTDFGLARRLDVAEVEAIEPPPDFAYAETFHTVQRLTATGAVMGTPSYMAPEQALDAKRAGPAADVWALGAVLYACLTGRPPFMGTTAVETITLVIETEPVAPRDLNPDVDRDLEAICLKCLKKDPAQRYASASELAADLARYRAGGTPGAVRVGVFERLRRLDAAFPEVLPVLAGLVANRFSNLQEGLFAGCAVAGMRLSLVAPNVQRLWLSALLWAILAGATPWVRAAHSPGEEYPGTRPGSVSARFSQDSWWTVAGTGVGVSMLVGVLAGVVLSIGTWSIAEAETESLDWVWYYRMALLLAVAGTAATLPLAIHVHSSAFRFYSDQAGIRHELMLFLHQWTGPVSALLFVAPFGVAMGTIVGEVCRRLAGGATFAVRLGGALTMIGVLWVVPMLCRTGKPPELAVVSYLSPGPMLTLMERVVGTLLPLPLLTIWPMIFLGKFVLLALGLCVGGVLTGWLFRGRKTS